MGFALPSWGILAWVRDLQGANWSSLFKTKTHAKQKFCFWHACLIGPTTPSIKHPFQNLLHATCLFCPVEQPYACQAYLCSNIFSTLSFFKPWHVSSLASSCMLLSMQARTCPTKCSNVAVISYIYDTIKNVVLKAWLAINSR